jgi:hypothetical protein
MGHNCNRCETRYVQKTVALGWAHPYVDSQVPVEVQYVGVRIAPYRKTGWRGAVCSIMTGRDKVLEPIGYSPHPPLLSPRRHMCTWVEYCSTSVPAPIREIVDVNRPIINYCIHLGWNGCMESGISRYFAALGPDRLIEWRSTSAVLGVQGTYRLTKIYLPSSYRG